MRYLSPDTFTDEIIAKDLITLATWIGLITAMADDQGRMLDNPALIRATLFPYNEKITISKINDILKYFENKHKITRYYAGTNGSGRKLIQIVAWWKYQRSAQWAAASSYPAPEKWIDRVRMHVSGGSIQQLNWDQDGGYLATTKRLRSAKIAGKVPGELCKDNDVNNEDDVNNDVNGNKRTATPTPPSNRERSTSGRKAGGKKKKENGSMIATFETLKGKQRKRADLTHKVLASLGIRNPKLETTSILVATRIYKNDEQMINELFGAIASVYADGTAKSKEGLTISRLESGKIPASFINDRSLWRSVPPKTLAIAGLQDTYQSKLEALKQRGVNG